MPVITITGTTDTQDAQISQTDATTNYGTLESFGVGEATAPFDGVLIRSLIKFVLTAIPAGSTINSAVLSIFIEANFASNTRDINVYRVLRAWTEGGATWNTYDGSNNWGTAGAGNTTTDREGSNIGSASVSTGPAADTEIQITLTAASIQEMLSGGSFTNNGFLLQMTTETDDFHSYRSSEYASDTSKRPKLVINYTDPATTSTTTSTTTTSTSSSTTTTSTSSSTSSTTSTSTSTSITTTSTTTTSTSTTTTSTTMPLKMFVSKIGNL